MKKIIAIMLAACCLLSLAACGAKEADYKLGLGVELSTASSAENNAQVDATVAAVILDASGKIVQCRIDVAQNKMDVTGGAVDTAKTFKTKMELGSEYGMAGIIDNNGDGVMKEWNEQANAFEAYVVGKTAAEVKAIETQEANGHQIAVDEALLSAGCSMQITDFMAAVVKACEDKAAVAFKAGEGFKLGVAAISTAAESTAATADANGSANMYTDYGAAVVGADGKILAALNDATQPKIAISAAGVVEADFKATKRELGSEYGMAGIIDNNGDSVMKEWYEQSAAFSAFVVGKTAAEVAGLETQEVNAHHIAVDEDLLAAGCSMQITGLKAVVAQAANYAR